MITMNLQPNKTLLLVAAGAFALLAIAQLSKGSGGADPPANHPGGGTGTAPQEPTEPFDEFLARLRAFYTADLIARGCEFTEVTGRNKDAIYRVYLNLFNACTGSPGEFQQSRLPRPNQLVMGS